MHSYSMYPSKEKTLIEHCRQVNGAYLWLCMCLEELILEANAEARTGTGVSGAFEGPREFCIFIKCNLSQMIRS